MATAISSWNLERRSGLLALPEDVLAVILGHLCHLPSLLAVRLVCRVLRKTSYYVITSLNIDKASLDPKRQRPGIAEQLAILPCLTKLRIYEHDEVLERSDILKLPQFASLLQELTIGRSYSSAGFQAVSSFCEAVKAATAITSLEWRMYGIRGLLPLLASCTRLQLLEVDTWQFYMPATLCDAVLRLSHLDTLRVRYNQKSVWEGLVPSLSALPCLRDLATVPVGQPATATKLASLTRLIRLQVCVAESLDAHGLKVLSRLSALKSLGVQSLRGRRESRSALSFEWLPVSMSHLTELCVHGEFLITGFKKTVGSLSRLSRLALRGSPCPVVTLWQAPLQGLRHLSLKIEEGGFVKLFVSFSMPMLAGLESLSLEAYRVSDTEGIGHFAELTRLTSLRIIATNAWRPVPATFLTGLAGLTELVLHKVLSAHNAEADIQCVARLTRLRRLELTSREIDRYKYDAKTQAVNPLPLTLDRRHFLPRKALRLLEAWSLDRAWRTPTGHACSPDQVVKELCCCSGYSPIQDEASKDRHKIEQISVFRWHCPIIHCL